MDASGGIGQRKKSERGTYWLFAIHGIQPSFAVLFAERLQRERQAGLLLECQIEAKPLLKVGRTSRALHQRQILGRLLGAPGYLIVRQHGKLLLLLLVCTVELGPCCRECFCKFGRTKKIRIQFGWHAASMVWGAHLPIHRPLHSLSLLFSMRNR